MMRRWHSLCLGIDYSYLAQVPPSSLPQHSSRILRRLTHLLINHQRRMSVSQSVNTAVCQSVRQIVYPVRFTFQKIPSKLL